MSSWGWALGCSSVQFLQSEKGLGDKGSLKYWNQWWLLSRSWISVESSGQRVADWWDDSVSISAAHTYSYRSGRIWSIVNSRFLEICRIKDLTSGVKSIWRIKGIKNLSHSGCLSQALECILGQLQMKMYHAYFGIWTHMDVISSILAILPSFLNKFHLISYIKQWLIEDKRSCHQAAGFIHMSIRSDSKQVSGLKVKQTRSELSAFEDYNWNNGKRTEVQLWWIQK